jgi:endoribonuclease Dicer
VGDLHECIIKLPPNAPIYQVIGLPQHNELLAKQVASLEACRLLHVMGALNDHLIPITDHDHLEEEESMKLKNTFGAGV